MAKWEDSEPVNEAAIRKRFNALDRRIARCERMQKQILDQLRELNTREGDGPTIESYTNPSLTHHVLSIIEELETDEKGANGEVVKEKASEENLLKTETKMKINELVEDGYLLEESDGHYRVVKYPDEDREDEAEHPEELGLGDDRDEVLGFSEDT